ncbi:VWA domain-containing protein [Anaerolineales bacterium HSG24]|nr:VWA domain-containing protein [Anaerolineales bacterium HSG24]
MLNKRRNTSAIQANDYCHATSVTYIVSVEVLSKAIAKRATYLIPIPKLMLMQQLLIEFIAGLRQAGVRISIAESEDMFRAVNCIGMLEQAGFKEALRGTLIKSHRDETTFEALFDQYFQPPETSTVNLLELLSPHEKKLLFRAVNDLLGQLKTQEEKRDQLYRSPTDLPGSQVERLEQLLNGMLEGQPLDPTTFDEVAEQVMQKVGPSASVARVHDLTMNQLGNQLLTNVENRLPNLLRQNNLQPQTVSEIMAGLQLNQEALQEQATQQSQRGAANRWAKQQGTRLNQAEQLMGRSLQQLSEREANLLRQQIRRLVAQLRSRIALRRKRARRGKPDIRQTIRTNLRYGGIPIRLKFKTKSRKPRLLLLCDISHSMRKVIEFALRLVYELQDQVTSVRTFTFIDTLDEISQIFAQSPANEALAEAATRLRPNHANTDLGTCLEQLLQQHRDCLTPQTTVIIVGDACNSWNDPRLDCAAKLQRMSKQVIWLNPRQQNEWNSNDCDMLKYLPYADAVYQVGTMAELASAVDKLLTR